METPSGSPTPPPQFAQYPRGPQGSFGTAAALRQLREAYYGSQWMIAVSLGGVGLTVAMMLAVGSAKEFVLLVPVIRMVGYGAVVVANAFIAYKYLSLLAAASDKGSGSIVGYTILCSLLSFCCFGVLGPVIIQSMCGTELAKYGLKAGPFTALKKNQINELVRQYEEREATKMGMPSP